MSLNSSMTAFFPAALLFIGGFTYNCADTPENARLGSAPRDYKRLGLTREVRVREDGMRTDGKPGTFEWWYFDGHLKGGAKIVIVFFTKPMTEQNRPLSPFLTINIDYPDGRKIKRELKLPANRFSASREKCDVRIGENYFRGDLRNYRIRAHVDDVKVDFRLKSMVDPFRPATGYFLFGNKEQHYFAWLAAVPRGEISGTLTVKGKTSAVSGSGYHDHNWGNIGPHKAMNNWYWARAELGEYTVITSYITAEKKFSHVKIPIFMLARGRRIIAADGEHRMRFERANRYYDKTTGKPIDNMIRSVYTEGNKKYTLTFRRKKNIVDFMFKSKMNPLKKFLATLAGFDGAYHRFVGDVGLEIRDGNRREKHTGEAIWELMYFGRNLD